MERIKKNDFVEIEFTGKANDKIFDTTFKKEAESMGLDVDVKPVIVSVGNKMLLKSFDEELEGKEFGKKYNLHLTSEKAFGKRNPNLIKTMPIKIFHQQNMNPSPGMTVQLDQNIAKIISVSGGRVMVDFNNPLAGKDIEYEFKITKKIIDNKEKVNALQDFFFRQRFDFYFKEDEKIKTKKVVFSDEKAKPFIELFKDNFKKIIGFDIEFGIKDKQSNQKDSSK